MYQTDNPSTSNERSSVSICKGCNGLSSDESNRDLPIPPSNTVDTTYNVAKWILNHKERNDVPLWKLIVNFLMILYCLVSSLFIFKLEVQYYQQAILITLLFSTLLCVLFNYMTVDKSLFSSETEMSEVEIEGLESDLYRAASSEQ